MDRVDNLPDVRLLKPLDSWVERQDLVIDDRSDADVVDVIGGVEWMTLDVVGHGAEVEAEAVEEHDRDVDALVPGGDDAIAEAVEIGLVERCQVKLRFAVRSCPGSGPWPRLRRHAEVEVAAGSLGRELLPTPEPDEVVAMVLQKCEVGIVVVLLRGLGAIGARTETVVKVVPDVRTGQVDHLPVAGIARRDREVAGVGLGDHEGTSGGVRSAQWRRRDRDGHGDQRRKHCHARQENPHAPASERPGTRVSGRCGSIDDGSHDVVQRLHWIFFLHLWVFLTSRVLSHLDRRCDKEDRRRSSTEASGRLPNAPRDASSPLVLPKVRLKPAAHWSRVPTTSNVPLAGNHCSLFEAMMTSW